MAELSDIRENVRARYAAAARSGSCCEADEAGRFGATLYGAEASTGTSPASVPYSVAPNRPASSASQQEPDCAAAA